MPRVGNIHHTTPIYPGQGSWIKQLRANMRQYEMIQAYRRWISNGDTGQNGNDPASGMILAVNPNTKKVTPANANSNPRSIGFVVNATGTAPNMSVLTQCVGLCTNPNLDGAAGAPGDLVYLSDSGSLDGAVSATPATTPYIIGVFLEDDEIWVNPHIDETGGAFIPAAGTTISRLIPNEFSLLRPFTSPLPDIADVGQDWLDAFDTWANEVENAQPFIYQLPSGLETGTPPGRVVCVGPGITGTMQALLAYANPSPGQEFRARPFGITIEAGPAVGDLIRIKTFGKAPYVHQGSTGSDGAPLPYSAYGKLAYLMDSDDEDDDSTKGYVTDDPAQSDNDAVVGMFWPKDAVLVQPVLPYSP